MERILRVIPRGEAEKPLYDTMCTLMSGYVAKLTTLKANCRPRERTDHGRRIRIVR
jgi:hypothetical protein